MAEERGAEKLVAGGAWQVIGFALSGLFFWLTTVLLSRSDIGLGPEKYGIFSIINSFVMMFGVIPSALNISVSRILQEEVDIQGKIKKMRASTSAALLMMVALAGIMAASVVAFYSNPDLRKALLLASVAPLISFIVMVLMGSLNGFYAYTVTGISFAVYAFMVFFLNVSLLYLAGIKEVTSPTAMAWMFSDVFIISTLVQLLFLAVGMKFCIKINPVKTLVPLWIKNEVYYVLKKTLWCIPPLLLSANTYPLYSLLAMSAYGVPAEKVAMFQLAIGYASATMLVSSFALVSVPEIGRAFEMGDSPLVKALIRGAIKAEIFLSGVLYIIYFMIAKPVLIVFHGPEYEPATIPYIILITGTLLTTIEYANIMILVGLKRERDGGIIATLTFAVASAIFTALLAAGFFISFPDARVPVLNTAAWTLVSTAFPFTAYTYYLIKKEAGYLPVQSLTKGLVSAIVSWILAQWFVVKFSIGLDVVGLVQRGAIGSLLFIAVLFASGFIDDQDFSSIYETLDSMGMWFFKPLVKPFEKVALLHPLAEKDWAGKLGLRGRE